MKLENLMTAEQIAAEPTFADKLRGIENYVRFMETDLRTKFHVCLHEGGHVTQMRRYGVEPDYHGPYIGSDGRFAIGAVSPKGDKKLGPFEEAAVYIAGPLLVRLITGAPEHKDAEENDLACLKRKLNTTEERFEQAKQMGEFAILVDSQKPDFLSRLEMEVRAYESEIFGTDETWAWAWKEYCLDWFRERVPVGSNTLGKLMFLIPDGESVRLFLHGQERSPADKIYGCTLEVYPMNPGGRVDAVRRWNEKVRL